MNADEDEWVVRANGYLNYWEKILEGGLGWGKEKVHQWGADLLRKLSGPTVYHHEPAEYYIAHLFIPETLRNTLEPRPMLLLEEKISAILRDAVSVARDRTWLPRSSCQWLAVQLRAA